MNTQPKMTFTSPNTNKTYTIIPTNEFGWFRYEIYDDNRSVQFALKESGIADAVRHYELPGPDLGSRWD